MVMCLSELDHTIFGARKLSRDFHCPSSPQYSLTFSQEIVETNLAAADWLVLIPLLQLRLSREHIITPLSPNPVVFLLSFLKHKLKLSHLCATPNFLAVIAEILICNTYCP